APVPGWSITSGPRVTGSPTRAGSRRQNRSPLHDCSGHGATISFEGDESNRYGRMTGPRPPSDPDDQIPRLLHGVETSGRLGGAVGEGGVLTDTPFVGREQLLQQIYELADGARSGHGVVVALSGEMGIGKTRLLREVARRGPAIGFAVDWIG